MKALAALALLAALAGCGSPTVAAPPPAATPTPSAPASTQPGELKIDPSFNSEDLAWIELMIPMDDQLLRVLAMAEQQASDPAIRAFATSVADGHRTELEQLKETRTRSGLPIRNPHEGHDMLGMMTEPEIVALGKTSGAAFDQLFVKNLKEHLDETIVMAGNLGKMGKDPRTKEFAAAIAVSRAAQVKELAAL
ncbi:DUF305 domain-containing protein [Kribbella sandramycini]|uniref:DUF305 domain-containing protein n=1 Tax=Kribbella sandramycini TaxID=60450 RepID=A0A7Y4NYR6_9ACTN|nr:DUF305 domain-containing protein [Kribbella sandramycini]MBB6568207.1 uncharacterized protein (DUF305 family) [Kribbella sandramycini]NOL39199.1 DUF305 domain-containing protein [Kribbella sandramycini]